MRGALVPTSGALLAAVIAVLPAPAAAQRCVRVAGSLFVSPGCTPPPERASDRGEAAFWQERYGGKRGDPAALFPMPAPPDRRFPSPMPLPRQPAREGATTLDDLELRPDGRGGYQGQRPGFRYAIDPDGTVHFRDRPAFGVSAFLLLGMAGFFDLTDLVMRLHGDDPYAYDKSLVLRLTGPMRAQMTEADRRRRIQQALASLPRDLAALWARRDLGAGQRRELLFRLWDELLEQGAPHRESVQAADAARRLIVDFVQRQLPAGSPDAYTDQELQRLNGGRRSQAAFAPYR